MHLTKQTPGARPVGRYVPELDGLRALAIGLVILIHLSSRAVPGGQVGVDIFFTLSGYLITTVLLREMKLGGRISLRNFYIRRLLRLMPALIVMVAVQTAYECLFGGPDPHFVISSVVAVLYLMDFVQAFSSLAHWSAVSHTWSLAVEEHFYLLWPPLLIVLFAFSAKLRSKMAVGLWVLMIAWRAYLVASGASLERTYFSFDARWDELMAGCILAFILADGYAPRLCGICSKAWPAALFIVAAIALFNHGSSSVSRAFMPVIASASSCILILALLQAGPGLRRVAANPGLVAIGRLSYSIYLWHWPILIEVRYHTSNQIAALAAIAASICIAMVSYHFVEQPALKLKRHFEFKPAAVTADAL